MKPKISIVTLGVADVGRSLRFYRDGLGFPTHNYQEGEDFVMFRMEGSWLALYPLAALAEDAGLELATSGFRGATVSHNEPSPEAVDATFAEAVAAGATVIKRPEKVFWGGYSGYFADPDGHLWEVAHNPFTDLT
jgi:catechol 2,3-dioxygenase-like lactoylglutathione lyase family enzyme